MKAVFRAHGLPIVEHVVVMRARVARDARRACRARVAEAHRLSVLRQAVEPRLERRHQQGARRPGELAAAIDEAARHDRKILVERAVRGREIEVSVLGNDEPRGLAARRDPLRRRVVRLRDEVRRGPGAARRPGADRRPS